jgi:VanZ family protein
MTPRARPLRTATTLWWVFALFIVYGTTIPFHFTTDRQLVADHVSRLTPNPLVSSATGQRESIPDIVQNLLLFAPFGVLGILARGATARSVFVVTGLAAALGAAVEALQLFTLDRISSLGDVVFGTAGAFAGALVAYRGQRAWRNALGRLAAARLVDTEAFYPLMVAAIVICTGAWEPFDVTLDVSTVVSKIRALQGDVWQSTALTDEGVALVQYALFAVAASSWIGSIRTRRREESEADEARSGPREHPRWHDAVAAGAISLVAAFGLEASQIAITSRMPGLEDAVVRGAGGVIGALIWSLAGRRGSRTRPAQGLAEARAPRWWLVVLMVGTAAGAAIQVLSPFQEASAYRGFGWFPFLGYYVHTSFDTLSHVMELMLIYFPLGFCRVWWTRRPDRAVVTAIVVAVPIAAPLECLQGWIVGRYPDITDIGVSVLGACCGAWAASKGAALFAEAVSLERRERGPRQPERARFR